MSEPDLISYTERERRIFALGVNWAIGRAQTACVNSLRATAKRTMLNSLTASVALQTVADGFELADVYALIVEADQP